MSAWNALLPESSVTLCQSFRYLLKPSPQRSLPASPCLKEMCMHVCTHTHIHTTQSLFIFSHKTYHCLTLCVCVLVAQLCLTVCDPMDCSPPGSPVRGDSPDKNTEWVAIAFSRGSFQLRDRTWVSCIAGRFFTT